MQQNLFEIEKWQNSEDVRLEYEGYCNKIREGLEELDVRSGERAIWELIQNARDISEKARIKIELTDSSIVFSHHGKPFDYTSLRALVKQDSAKERNKNSNDIAGQYGTGFMTTHSFNRKVRISAPFAIKSTDGKIKGYVQIKDFEIDRTLVDTANGPNKMKEQLDIVKQFYKGNILSEIEDDTTSFCYDLKKEQVINVSNEISKATRLMPFVMIINSNIREIEIYNHINNEYFTLTKKSNPKNQKFGKEAWNVVTDEILLKNHKNNVPQKLYTCKSLQSDTGDVIFIPPFPEICGKTSNIPSLFLWFPLLGTESFGVNFIFHSKRFYPVEKRNNIMLPGSTPIKKDKGWKNNLVLKEMMEILFDYCNIEENSKTLTREMCEVSFTTSSDDAETKKFYEEMQLLWNKVIPNWKVLPIDDKYYAISDPNVKLLHRDFYYHLKPEQRIRYESILLEYAHLPKKSDGKSYLIPKTDIILWSETVDTWKCEKDVEFFISLADVCNAINSKRENLHSFLELMKESGNTKVFEDYALLPNREGDLHKKNELHHADFFTPEVYSLVKVLMGDGSAKIYDTEFLDICEVNSYTQKDLQSAITSTILNWRSSTLNSPNKQLNDEQLTALIEFCSAAYNSELKNTRVRMMRLIVEFYNKEFKQIIINKFRDENEEDFYSVAYNFLLDYTLHLLSLKDDEWVSQNKEWLRKFLDVYSPSTNEDRKKKLNDYGVLPNQKGKLCLMTCLRRNDGVPAEMVDLYNIIHNSDLKDSWIDEDFKDIISLTADTPKDIAHSIEEILVDDMKKEIGDRKFEKHIRTIILKLAESKDWQDWFARIEENKATYTFSMKSGNAQKSLFSLMDIADENLERLATLTKSGNIENILTQMERKQAHEIAEKARFEHLQAIGKHIENALRGRIQNDLFQVESLDDTQAMADDIQDGQDIVIRIKDKEEFKDIYYIEVKSKWDFSEPAHMSTRQIRNAVLHPDNYALCCVDLRSCKNDDLVNLPEQKILDCTRVKVDIGKELKVLMQEVIKADDKSDDTQIKISDYRSYMSAKVFEKGETIDILIGKIESKIKESTSL